MRRFLLTNNYYTPMRKAKEFIGISANTKTLKNDSSNSNDVF